MDKTFDTVFEEVNTSIFIYQDDYNIYVNKYACELTGYSREELLSQKYWELLHPDFRDVVKLRGQDRLEGKCVPAQYQVKILTKDGKEVWLEYFAKQIIFRDQPAVLGICYDITDAKSHKEKLEQSLGEKALFIKEIHHRVKNNLQLCLSLIEMHSHSIDETNYLKSFQDLQNRIKAISFIHSHLAEIETYNDISIKGYLQNLLDMITQFNDWNNTNVKVSLLTNDFMLDIDKVVPLGMIVNELVTNSFQHAFAPEVDGEIQVRLIEQNHKLVQLSISDNGTGLNAKELQDTSNSIGLQLVEGFVQQLQGNMAFESEKGTRIVIDFH